jgi:hypothetical protein
MVTRKPADAMGWSKRLGQISEGYLADVLVLDDRHPDPYRNLIQAIEENIQLVAVRGEPLYGDLALLKTARGGADDIETTSTFKGKRSKAMTPNCPATSLAPMSITETMSRIQQGLKLDPAQLAARLSPEQLAKDFAQCGLEPPKTSPTAADARRLLSCRFKLPFEKTRLNSLTTSDDPEFFSRLMKNPNLPKYLRALPAYYRQ